MISLVLIYLLAAFCMSRISIAREEDGPEDVSIYIMTNGVHADIVVPVKSEAMDWSSQVKFSNTTGNDSSMQWLALGWGDRGFYLETPTWADLKAKVALSAAFGLAKTVIHA